MNKVNAKYERFFFESRCITSNVDKRIPVLDPINLRSCLETLISDQDVEDETKLLIGLLFSGGMRISEALNLKRSDFNRDNSGTYTAKVSVLKKRKKNIERDASIHPLLNGLLAEKLASKRYNESLFRERATKRSPAKELKRQNALKKIKKVFGKGMTNHSLRHSNVALLLHLKYTATQIGRILEMTTSNVQFYSHVNASREMKNVFAGI